VYTIGFVDGTWQPKYPGGSSTSPHRHRFTVHFLDDLMRGSWHKDRPAMSVREWICQSWPIRTRSEQLPSSLKEMISAAQKCNATISVMRASSEHRLEMPAFCHPFAKNKNLQNNSRTMKCLQNNHGVKTVGDLIQISTMAVHAPANACPLRYAGGNNCCEKATELLNRIEGRWNPKRETPKGTHYGTLLRESKETELTQ
jgi:hypothetical protein